MPIITSQGSRSLAARLSSLAGALSGRLAFRASGSRRSSTSMSFAAAISLSVRWRMKIGLPRHMTVIAWPASTWEISTSVLDSDSADASGFIWSSNGQMAATAPTAAKPLAAIRMTSRRVGSSSGSRGELREVSWDATVPRTPCANSQNNIGDRGLRGGKTPSPGAAAVLRILAFELYASPLPIVARTPAGFFGFGFLHSGSNLSSLPALGKLAHREYCQKSKTQSRFWP